MVSKYIRWFRHVICVLVACFSHALMPVARVPFRLGSSRQLHKGGLSIYTFVRCLAVVLAALIWLELGALVEAFGPCCSVLPCWSELWGPGLPKTPIMIHEYTRGCSWGR